MAVKSAKWEALISDAFEAIASRINIDPRGVIPKLPNTLLRCESDGRTLLHRFADRENCEEFLTLLIKSGIPVDALDRTCCSALHVASQNGLTANSKLLCSLGGRLDPRTSSGKSAFECAIASGNAVLVRWMLEQPALSLHGWDNQLFYDIMASTPEAAMVFLDTRRRTSSEW